MCMSSFPILMTASREEADDATVSAAADRRMQAVVQVYLRLLGQDGATWQNHAQFFAVAARMIRRILVDHARTRRRITGSP